MRAFHRVYYLVAALTIAAASSLPWLVLLSYRALGFDPALASADTGAAVALSALLAGGSGMCC